MAGDRRHIHDPEKAADFARALGLMVGGHHPFVGDWQVKGLYAYRYGKYKGQAYFGTGGARAIVSKTLTIPTNLGNRIKNTVHGIAMTPKYQKTFDKNSSD